MRHIIAAFALAGLFSPLALAGERRPATTPAQITCGALPGVPSRIAYAAPQASACCAEDAACARLLATTVIKHGHGDLHT